MAEDRELTSFESAQDLLNSALEVDPDFTKDKVARLHREGLIVKPIERYQKGRKGKASLYPPGTKDLVREIARVKLEHRNLDEVAWRLWWDGCNVGMAPVRRYLVKIALRIDKPIIEARDLARAYVTGTMTPEQTTMYEQLFSRADVGPLLGPVRKRLHRDSDDYAIFVDTFLRLMTGRGEDRPPNSIQALERALGFDEAKRTELMGATDWFPGFDESTLDYADSFFEDTLAGRASRLTDEELAEVRDFLRWFGRYISTVGDVFHHLYGGAGLGFGLAGELMSFMTKKPSEQVPAVLILAQWFNDPEVRAGCQEVKTQAEKWLEEGYAAHVGLMHLSKTIPPVGKLVTPQRMKTALKSPEASEKRAERLHGLRELHGDWIDYELGEHPGIFGSRTSSSHVADVGKTK